MTSKLGTVRDYLTGPGQRIYDEGFIDGNQKQKETNMKTIKNATLRDFLKGSEVRIYDQGVADGNNKPCPVAMPGGNNQTCTCHDELKARIRNYLQNGGLFNPELMEHDKVRQLLLDVLEVL